MEFIIELPEYYEQVQYIETTGSQFIDTGILPDISTRWELDIQYTEKPTSQQFYNGLYNNVNCRFDIAYVKNGKFRLNIGSQSTFEPKEGDLLRHLFTLDIPRKRVEIDEDIYECSFNFTNASIGAIKIGNRYDPSVTYPCWEKIYSSKIYSNDMFAQYLIPCYNEANSEVGMYDLVEKEFYKNSGTGTFVCGPRIKKGEVIPIYSIEQYLKIGSNERIMIPEAGGKYYKFTELSDYILMNDLTINYKDMDLSTWKNPNRALRDKRSKAR